MMIWLVIGIIFQLLAPYLGVLWVRVLRGEKPLLPTIGPRPRKNTSKIQFDDEGCRIGYDPHYTRALEGVMIREAKAGRGDFSVPELTTCGDEDCNICSNANATYGMPAGAPEWSDPWVSKVIESHATLSERAVEIEHQGYEHIQEIEKKIQEQLMQDKEYAKYNTPHDPSKFRPSLMPDNATVVNISEDYAGIVIVWGVGSDLYRSKVPNHELRDGKIYFSKKRKERMDDDRRRQKYIEYNKKRYRYY